jgi:hypothetical protein
MVPHSHIHVSVSDFYIPRTGLPIWLQNQTFILDFHRPFICSAAESSNEIPQFSPSQSEDVLSDSKVPYLNYY